MRPFGVVSALSLSLALLSAARADEAAISADVRCVMVGMQMSASRDASQQSAGMMSVMYYVGRLDRVVPKSDLEGLIAKEESKWSTEKFQNEAVRCGKVIYEKGLVLEQIGKNLILRDQKQNARQSNFAP